MGENNFNQKNLRPMNLLISLKKMPENPILAKGFLVEKGLIPNPTALTLIIKGDDDFIDNLRNIVANYLQHVGFSTDDKITHEGVILEKLIDKFFIG